MVKLVITFKRKEGMSHQLFRDYRRDVHAPMLLAIPESKLIRKFVVSYPMIEDGGAEPDFDAMVEAWFDCLQDLTCLYTSENFLTKVDPDHINFIELSSVKRVISEEVAVLDENVER